MNYILKKLKNITGFCVIHCCEDTHYQFKFKEVYLENLFKNMKDYDYKGDAKNYGENII